MLYNQELSLKDIPPLYLELRFHPIGFPQDIMFIVSDIASHSNETT